MAHYTKVHLGSAALPDHASNRREFLAATASLLGCGGIREANDEAPEFLSAHKTAYRSMPRQACLEWFQKGHAGLSFQYGVYLQLGPDPWVRFRKAVSAAAYDRLKQNFTAESFSAESLVRFAQTAGASYIRFPARLWDGFSLFRTNETSFTSLSAPAGRDLVGEMTDACRDASMGLILEYAYGLDWRHPYFFPPDSVQPDWPYAAVAHGDASERRFQKDEDFIEYVKYAHVQLKEILYRYVPLAGIALTPVMGYFARPELFPLTTTYEIIREAQPQVLLSFERGANGEEDFVSLRSYPVPDRPGGEIAEHAWSKNKEKPREVLVSWEKAQREEPDLGLNCVREIQLRPNGALPELPN